MDRCARSHTLEVIGATDALNIDLLTPEALAFVAALDRELHDDRCALLHGRKRRQRDLEAGAELEFPAATSSIREDASWQVPPPPKDLVDRRIEIAGPASSRKIAINALNSGAQVWVADLEDATSPTWGNMLSSQRNLRDATFGDLTYDSPEGRSYRLAHRTATIVVRPRGWHLPEAHFRVDDRPVSASVFDFGLYFFHCARKRLENGSSPYFYLPKLEGQEDARLWNRAFEFAQHALGLPVGSVRATALIETISSAYEMDEILYALGPHAAGLTAGRWDYLFSIVRAFRKRADFVSPDRTSLTMSRSFMRAYTEHLIDTCHRRGTHAIGGVATHVPDRRDEAANERAMRAVRHDKEREADEGFDGTWVVHPDLVPTCRDAFARALGDRPHQIARPRTSAVVTANDLRAGGKLEGPITEHGLRNNIAVSIRYLEAWLRGQGSVALFGLMEGVATVEIARSQIGQWLLHGVVLQDGRQITPGLVRQLLSQEISATRAALPRTDSLEEARELFEHVALSPKCPPFLTLPGYERLLAREERVVA